MSISFPTFVRVLTGSITYTSTSILNRTQMDAGPPKQAPNQSYSYPTQSVQVVFTQAQFQAFLVWFKDPANGNYGAAWFDWSDDTISETTISARIVSGNFTAQPLTPTSKHMVLQATFEFHD